MITNQHPEPAGIIIFLMKNVPAKNLLSILQEIFRLRALKKIYERINGSMTGKVGIKLHTGEAHGPNIIPRPWVEALIKSDLPDASIVETNSYYEGDRYTTAQHRETLKINGWTFCPVDIMDEDGTVVFPVNGGKWFTEMHMGGHLTNYDSLFVLTHFKGHSKGGFGGSNKNIGIGLRRRPDRQGYDPHHTRLR